MADNKKQIKKPCLTCKGSRKKIISGCWGMVHKEIDCPDCQDQESKKEKTNAAR